MVASVRGYMTQCRAAAGIRERSGREIAEERYASLGLAKRYEGTEDGEPRMRETE